MTNQQTSDRHASGTTGDDKLSQELPIPVKEQPDPMLQMSTGRMGAGALTLVAIVAVFILAVVFYGLNSGTGGSGTTSPVSSSAPAAGGRSGAPTPGAQHTGPSGNG
jgi:hypothetical protein